jgi:hypothetical protein
MKIIKEHIILEKFTDEDSDPIHDLNIGMIRDIKEYVEYKTSGRLYTDWIGMSISINDNKYDFIDFYINSDNISNDVKLYGLRQTIFYNKLRMVKMFLKAGLKIKDALSPEHVLDLRRFYNLSDKLSKLVNDEFPGKLDVNEKFSEDSDPIADLGIGMMYNIKEFCEKTITNISSIPLTIERMLLQCVNKRKYSYVKYLLELGANVHYNPYSNKKIIEGDYPMRYAIFNNDLKMVKLLVKYGASIKASIDDYESLDTFIHLQKRISSELIIFLKQHYEE